MIRCLELKDIPTVVELEEEIFGESLGYEMLSEEISNPLIWFRVIEIDNEVIGYIGGYFFMDDGEIINFLINEKYQHKGYGTQLFNSIMDEAKSTGIKRVTLEVRRSNMKGINFYIKHNFKEISVRKHYYKNGEDALVMMKELIWLY